MGENIEFGVHKVHILPDNLITGHIYFEHSTGLIHIAISESEKQTFGSSEGSFELVWNALNATTVKKITEGLEDNIKEAYILVDENGNQKGDRINIYKESSLKSVDVVDQSLVFTYILADGEEMTVSVNIGELVQGAEYGDGLKVESGKVSVKVSDVDKNYLNLDDTGLSVTGMESDVVTTTEDITVAGGPLSNLLTSAGIKTINKGTDLQSLLFSLFCKELWPTGISSTAGSFNAKSGVASFSVTTSSASLVEPGTILYFNATQGSVNGYTASNASVSGLTYGYSTSNDNIKDGSNTSFSKSWSISSGDSLYELTLSGGDSPTTKTGANPQTISNYAITAKIGTNTCSASASGSVTYNGTIAEIPVYYGVSNIGNTRETTKSTLLPAQSKSVISSGNSSASKSVTGVYPCYYNVSSGVLQDTAVTKYTLQTSTTFTITNVPSEEISGKHFIFEYPSHKTVSSFYTLLQPNSYNYYTNISGGTLVDTVSTNAGKLSTTLTISNVPSEAVAQKHFKFEYTAQATINSVKMLNTLTNKYEDISNYEITSGIIRDGSSYKRLIITGVLAGVATYQITFDTESYKVTTGYTITGPFERLINGNTYQYNRLTTTDNQGIVSRKITLNSSLSS